MSDPFMFLAMSMLIDCPSVPVPADEEAAIIQLAHDARAPALSGTGFESISVTKCITNWDTGEPSHAKGRSENVSFYGLFPHIVHTANYRERYSIRCHRSLDLNDDDIINERESCTEELERYMRYAGLDHEVQLKGSVSVDDATAFLDYLLSYDFGKEHQVRIRGDLLRIHRLDMRVVRGQLRFSASFDHGGCATTTFRAIATRKDELVFGKVDGDMTIC